MRNTPWANIVLQSDTGANDSDKTLTVSTGKQWQIHSVYALLASTATEGNRQLDILITDASDNPIMKAVAGAVQPASQTYTYVFAVDNPQETGFTGDLMYRALPGQLILPAGYKVRVYDSAAVAAAADDLTLRLLVEERTE